MTDYYYYYYYYLRQGGYVFAFVGLFSLLILVVC